MNLTYFPFDEQTCSVQATSLHHTADELLILADFNLENFVNYVVEYDYSLTVYPKKLIGSGVKFKWRKYSMVGFDIVFKRNMKHYLWAFFLPSNCVDFIAGISFLVPPNGAIPG